MARRKHGRRLQVRSNFWSHWSSFAGDSIDPHSFHQRRDVCFDRQTSWRETVREWVPSSLIPLHIETFTCAVTYPQPRLMLTVHTLALVFPPLLRHHGVAIQLAIHVKTPGHSPSTETDSVARRPSSSIQNSPRRLHVVPHDHWDHD